MKKKTIGKIQLILGIILLLSAIIGSIFVTKYFYTNLEDGVQGIAESWSKDFTRLNITSDDHPMSQLVGNIFVQSRLFRYGTIIFFTNVAIIVILSLILMLQGLYNLSKK